MMKRVLGLCAISILMALPAFAKKNINGVETLTELSELVDPAHSAVIVVDMQNEIVSTQGGYNRPNRSVPANPEKHAVIPRFQEQVVSTQRLLRAARDRGVLVVYAEYIHRDQNGKMIVNGPECYCHHRENWVSCVVDGTWEAQVIRQLAPHPGEITIKKCRGDAFYDTYLDDVLREKGITNLILTGTAGGGCVLATAFGAMERGYYPVWVSDCVDDPKVVQFIVQGRWPVYRVNEILSLWNSGRQ